MIRISTLLVLTSFLVCHSNSCSDKIYDIHNFLTDAQDAGTMMETNIRVQYNSFIGDRVKSVGTILNGFKTLQDGLPADLCKYQSIELGLNIIHAMNVFINVVRKNVLYSVKSSLDDAKTDQSNILYDFITYINDFIDLLGVGSKNLFNDGKGCVVDMKGEIDKFLDVSSKKFMECLKTASITIPVVPTKFLTYQSNLMLTIRTISYNLQVPFYYTWMYTTKLQNDTNAEKLNKVSIHMQGMTMLPKYLQIMQFGIKFSLFLKKFPFF